MADLSEQGNRLRQKLNNLSRAQKKLAAGVAVAAVIFLLLYYMLVHRVTYGVLFSNLELAHSANIVEEIEQMGIAYRVEDGGRTILVDENEMTSLRLELAMAGDLMDGTAGYELFDDQGLMVTDQDRRIMYQRATQGELERTFRSLDAVRAARVHLSLADDSVFAVNPRQGSATVVLDLVPQGKLSPAQVEGMVSLVSGAVKDIPPENVKVLDSRANLLSENIRDEGGHAAGMLDERQRIIDSYESRIAENLTELLEKTFGRDQVAVSVLAEIDLNSEERFEVAYDGEPVILQREERYSAEDMNEIISGGPIDDNVQNLIVETEEGLVESYEGFTEYAVGRTEVSSAKAVGVLEKLNISVVYDGALSADMQERMENIVSAAAGVDLERGDLINVDGIAFDRSYEEEIAQEMEDLRRQAQAEEEIFGIARSLFITIVASLAGLLVFIILIVLLGSARKSKRRNEELAAARARNQQRTARKEEGSGDGEEVPDLGRDELDESQKTDLAVKKYAKENPEEMAELLKSWIKE